MGRKCSAPGCNSNYDKNKEYVSSFKFPSDENRRNLWIRSLNREFFEPSSTAVVCIKHFEERFIVREDRVQRADGSMLIVKRTRPALSVDAFPTIFENLPKYLTKKLPTQRKDPEERRQSIIDKDSSDFNQWCADDIISSFEDLTKDCASKLGEEWTCKIRSEYVLFFRIKETDVPAIITSFKIYKNMSVEIFHENSPIDVKSFKWLLGAECKCDRWTKFDNILNLLLKYDVNNLKLNEKLSFIVHFLDKCLTESNFKDDDNLFIKLKFLKQQISLMNSKRLQYPSDIIIFSSKIFFSYPAAYTLIRDSKIFTLPHPSYLKKLASMCIPNSTYCRKSHVSFLKNKSNLLKEEEKIVNVLLDEIYINPLLNYKAGRIIGMSENSDAAASTIQTYMISSVLSKNKDVVALFPVRNLTTDILLKYTNEVLKVLHDCGFTVLSLISDNNRVNRNMFTCLSGGELKPFINNPYCPSKKLFFLFDSVHLIKSIRNNWLSQGSIYFPNPSDRKICSASLTNLKNIYEVEKTCVLKLAPKLSQKVLFPNKIEKQNVRLALNIFHETNCSALEVYKERAGVNYLETKMFLEFIANWWKIVNVKHPHKGEHLNDNMCYPIKSLKDDNFIFLEKFSLWLNELHEINSLKADEKKKLGIPSKGGMLSRETFFALKFTTDTMIEIVKNAFENLGMSYILLGKFQTDSLEARFGQYRQMSGGNYNISCSQVMESERKLKILNLLSLYSENEGRFNLRNLDFSIQNDYEVPEVPEFLYEVFNSYDDDNITNDVMSVLVYLAGYVAFKICHKLTCEECIISLTMDKTLEFECTNEVFKYLMISDRKQLKWPQKLLVDIICISFQIFQKLIKQPYENIFMRYSEPKNLLIQLIMEKLEYSGIDLDKKCNCGNNYYDIVKQCLSAITNIYLNNYIKVKNDKKSNSAKRKLSTLINS